MRKNNSNTKDEIDHRALLDRAHALVQDAQGGFQGSGIGPLVEQAFPGAQVGRIDTRLPVTDGDGLYYMTMRITWEGSSWLLRGQGNTLLGATMACVSEGGICNDDEFDAYLLEKLDSEIPF